LLTLRFGTCVCYLGSRNMDCPVCKESAMITLELNEVEIDYCTVCDGIWLDAGELELLLGEPEKARTLIESFKVDTSSVEKPKKCPICDKKMQKVIVGSSEPPLLIDRCSRGDGLWFDKGELNDIFEKAKLDKENKIQELLKNMFEHD
jgi:Zn-finger nucleic acid-binding protein